MANPEGNVNVGFNKSEDGTVDIANNNSDTGKKVELDEETIKREKRGILKNVIAISIAFMFLFTAFQSMASLQSSLNAEENAGTNSLIAIYVSICLSCMFVPTYMINKLTVKWALFVSMFTYSLYIIAQFYPKQWTLIPTGIILGFGAAPLWSSKCTYLTQVGYKYAELTKQSSEAVIVQFFGIFFCLFQTWAIWGNIISFTVLSPEETTRPTDEALLTCGLEFCPGVVATDLQNGTVENKNLEKPTETKIYVLAGIYLACSLVAAAIIALVVDPLTKYGEKEREGQKGKSGFQLLMATFHHLISNKYQILLIPLTFWSGFEQGYFGADFTQAFITCAVGVHVIGKVLITYGVVDAIFSFTLGRIIKYTGRLPIFVGAAALNVIALIIIYSVKPHPDQPGFFYGIAILWGIADAVWQTQINAFYGVLFPENEEAAFSNYRLWESAGFITAYIFHNHLCVRTITGLLLAELCLGMTGYFIIEFMEFKKKKAETK